MSELTYATVCSGIECMSAAAIGLPLRPVFFSEIEPFPCAVLKHRFPNVPNLGDMSRITVNEKGEITNGRTTVALPAGGLDILAGGTPCFTAGTMVLTERGYRPIETLCVGDRVVSGDGIIRTVEAVGSKMARHGLFKAIGRPPVDCTPNHPMMCVSMKRDNRRSSDTYASLIPVGDFEKSCAENSVGKYIGRRAVRNEMYNVGFPKCYDCDCGDIMELAGWYLGDGYIRRTAGKNKKCVVLTLCSHAKIERFNKVFDSKLNYSRFKDGRIQISCTALADWLSFNFGEHSNGKRIPYWCYDRENTHRLLRGYEATDGHDYGTHFKFTTTSKSLAYGIADLYNNAAISFHKVNPVGTICGRKVNQKDYWEVQAFKNETPRTKWVKDRYASKVRSYNGTNGLVRVYNITVSEDHTYIADGLYTHNCQDVSNAGRRRGMQEGSGTRSSLAFEFVRLIRELRPDTSFGRTWREYSPTNPSQSSSARLQTAGMVLPTGRSTPSTSGARILTCRMEEWCGWSAPSRRDDGVCGLSDVLEKTSGEHLKYFLSRKACAGIVRRAASRGKELPKLLADALAYQIAWWDAQAASTPTSREE